MAARKISENMKYTAKISYAFGLLKKRYKGKPPFTESDLYNADIDRIIKWIDEHPNEQPELRFYFNGSVWVRSTNEKEKITGRTIKNCLKELSLSGFW